ncbi:hypothetical protein ACVWYH_007419 [Bradyrhizobium sp. GM24.11]
MRKVTVLPFTVIESPSAGDDATVLVTVEPSSVAVPARLVVPSTAFAAVPFNVPAVEPSDAPSAAAAVTGVTPPAAPV